MDGGVVAVGPAEEYGERNDLVRFFYFTPFHHPAFDHPPPFPDKSFRLKVPDVENNLPC